MTILQKNVIVFVSRSTTVGQTVKQDTNNAKVMGIQVMHELNRIKCIPWMQQKLWIKSIAKCLNVNFCQCLNLPPNWSFVHLKSNIFSVRIYYIEYIDKIISLFLIYYRYTLRLMCLPKEEMNAKETFCLKSGWYWQIIPGLQKKTNNKTAVFLCYCSRLSNNVVVIIANLNMPNMQSYWLT